LSGEVLTGIKNCLTLNYICSIKISERLLETEADLKTKA